MNEYCIFEKKSVYSIANNSATHSIHFNCESQCPVKMVAGLIVCTLKECNHMANYQYKNVLELA